eukprot:12929367-Prorocentrum_lima.AAC.1
MIWRRSTTPSWLIQATKNLDVLETAEELLISQTEHQTCKGYGGKARGVLEGFGLHGHVG